ncbi:MAG TPA: hypothetical protein DD618_03530 [Acholeplasmatales bacterium]|nr:hypothetical protein [Acholeplasmatales bacterium]
MLITFKVNNFLSFSSEQMISLVPSLQKSLTNHFARLNDLDILKQAVIFGANSSGKSNFIKAMALGKSVVLEGMSTKHKNLFSKLDPINKTKESMLEYTFFTDGLFYSYGFCFVLYDCRITKEWLYEINPKTDKNKMLFERDLTENTFSTSIRMPIPDKHRFETYLHDMEGNDQVLFVGEMNRNKQLDESFQVFSRIYSWFKNNLVINMQDIGYSKISYFTDAYRAKFLEVLKMFDTGISEIVSEPISFENFTDQVPKKIFDELMAEIAEKAKDGEECRFGLRLPQALFGILVNPDREITITTTMLKHLHSEMLFEFAEESEGTKRLFELIDILINPREGTIYVIDEIDRSIHPLLVVKYLEFYLEHSQNFLVQILFSTHETNILSQELFRRDEVWFMEKGEDNSSRIFSLDIFKERLDKKISASYLEGSYGGVPIIPKNGDR